MQSIVTLDAYIPVCGKDLWISFAALKVTAQIDPLGNNVPQNELHFCLFFSMRLDKFMSVVILMRMRLKYYAARMDLQENTLSKPHSIRVFPE